VLAAGRAAKPATAINQLLSSATWAAPQADSEAPTAGNKKARGKKAAAAAAAAAAAGGGSDSITMHDGVRLAPGADAAYDAAVAEQQYLQDSYEAEQQAQLQWYASQAAAAGGGWGQQQQWRQQQQQWRQQQQQQPGGQGLQVQEALVIDEAGGVIGLVST
jgi:hypothetical protein